MALLSHFFFYSFWAPPTGRALVNGAATRLRLTASIPDANGTVRHRHAEKGPVVIYWSYDEAASRSHWLR